VLLRAFVKDGNVIFSDKVAYKFLLFPGMTKMSPNKMMSVSVAEKILALVKDGATIFVKQKPNSIPGKHSGKDKQAWQKAIDELWSGQGKSQWNLGKGNVVQLPYFGNDFSKFGIQPDVVVDNKDANTVAWTHRETANEDVYFLSNQKEEKRQVEISFRVSGKIPVLHNPVTDETIFIEDWKIQNGRTTIPLQFEANESYFIIFKDNTDKKVSNGKQNWTDFKTVRTLNEDWMLQFDAEFNGPEKPVKINKLFDWSTSTNDSIKYYSGTVEYSKTFDWKEGSTNNLWLQFQEINSIASIRINGKDCGTLWTYPYRVSISKALKKGQNTLIVKVTNTWANRLIGDQKLQEKDHLTWTTAPFRLEGNPLLKSGLLRDVKIIKEQKQ
jgi:hypothetical protein